MMNTNEKKVEETNTQAQENAQVAEAQQPQVPAQPEEKQHWYDKPVAVGKKIHNSKAAKVARGLALVGFGAFIGYEVANGKSDDDAKPQTVAEPVAEVQATEVPTEE